MAKTSFGASEPNAEQAFYASEINSIMEKIYGAMRYVAYLTLPIIETTIHLNRDGRYETANGHEYTCGSGTPCLLISDDCE